MNFYIKNTMPYRLEERKEKSRLYYLENKEKLKQYSNEYAKIYSQTETGRKSGKINKWKHRGVITDDYSSLYDYYINCNNCEECDVELVEGNLGANKRCLDHDHITGLFRNVLCNTCNLRRG